MNLHITDFPEYPWKTLDVHKDFSYSFNISPGKKIEEDLFDSSKMKVVSYNENSHVADIGCMWPLRYRLSMYAVIIDWFVSGPHG